MRLGVHRQPHIALGEHQKGTLFGDDLGLHESEFSEIGRRHSGGVELVHAGRVGRGVEVRVGRGEGAGAGEVVADGHAVGFRGVAGGGEER